MKTIKDEIRNLKKIMKMISKMFGDRCEVVLHDLTRDYDNTIVRIENGHVTNRSVGDSGSNLGLLVLSGKEKTRDSLTHLNQTPDGKMLRSCSVYLENAQEEIVGSICINLDISDLLLMESIASELVMRPEVDHGEPEIFANNVGEILDFLTQECQKHIGKPTIEMTREDKIKAVSFFNSKGAFLIAKAGSHVCEYLNISQYTLYKYLDMVRLHAEEEIRQTRPR